MTTYYIPVHYYERDNEDDAVVKLVIQRDIGKCELDEILMDEYRKHNPAAYPIIDDMADAMFDSFAKRVDGVWSYCDTLSLLTVGDPELECEVEQDEQNPEMIKLDAEALAPLLITLNVGETLNFFVGYDEESGKHDGYYGATVINVLESYIIYINCYGGGTPCAIDVTCFDNDLKRIRDDLAEYFKYIEGCTHIHAHKSAVDYIKERCRSCQ